MSVLPDMYTCTIRKKSVPFLPEETLICTGTVANSWRTSTEINKSGSAAKERDLVEQVRDLKILALFRMGFFGAAHGWVEGQTHTPPLLPKICHTYPTKMKLGTVLP